mmetsp:Transcript_18607/g.29677  ORF Transcript_18607/g.29677 Transcript_18607/m.29677 type:complete len:200 (+) Transcript_18607:669-1268(+)
MRATEGSPATGRWPSLAHVAKASAMPPAKTPTMTAFSTTGRSGRAARGIASRRTAIAGLFDRPRGRASPAKAWCASRAAAHGPGLRTACWPIGPSGASAARPVGAGSASAPGRSRWRHSWEAGLARATCMRLLPALRCPATCRVIVRPPSGVSGPSAVFPVDRGSRSGRGKSYSLQRIVVSAALCPCWTFKAVRAARQA